MHKAVATIKGSWGQESGSESECGTHSNCETSVFLFNEGLIKIVCLLRKSRFFPLLSIVLHLRRYSSSWKDY